MRVSIARIATENEEKKMQIGKDMVLNLLREQDKHGEADQAAQELPDQVDPDGD